MIKYFMLFMSLVMFQFCGPSDRDIAIQNMNSCLAWNTKEACELQLNMKVMEYQHINNGGSSFFFFHGGGYYYPYGTSYYYMGSHYPTASQFTEMRERYGANSTSRAGGGYVPSSATPVARANAARVGAGSSPLSYSSTRAGSSTSHSSRSGGFGSRAGYYGGGIS